MSGSYECLSQRLTYLSKAIWGKRLQVKVRVPDLPQHDDALLRAPIGADVKHAGAIAPDDPVVHRCVLADVSVHGPDHSHRGAKLDGLGNPDLIESCGRKSLKSCDGPGVEERKRASEIPAKDEFFTQTCNSRKRSLGVDF